MNLPAMTAIVDALKASGMPVYRGRSDDVGDSETDTYPAIVVRTLSEIPRIPQPATFRPMRTVEVRALMRVAPEEYEGEMDDMSGLLYRALAPLTQPDEKRITGIEITGVEYDHPDPGSEIASVSFTLEVSYVLTLQED